MADERSEGSGRRKYKNSGSAQDYSVQENGIDDEPDFNDPPGYVDDVTEEELVGDLLRQKPQEADGIDSVVVVDNVPQVGPERLEKLRNVIRKIFNKFGKIVTEHYPEADGKTKGYIFLEYSSPNQAAEAVKMTNGYKLDKQHSFIVNLFTDFDKYIYVPDEWEPPEPQPYKDTGNLYSWLMNADCHDQFSVIYDGGEKTAIMLHTGQDPTVVEERGRWTETYIRWSPHGTYLVTFHQKGIALWGGEKFSQIMRFSHPGVQLIEFSPCERYLVTFSPMPDHKDEPTAIIIWDVRTGHKKRGFHCENASAWPIFKWNFDGSYFARIGPDAISIYETPSFGLLDKKSMKIKSIKEFGWSPTDNIISYWVPEAGEVPARVVLLEIPSRRELQVKNLFSVADCKMHWQKCGDYLCVKVDRYSKAIKKEKEPVKYAGMYHNFELFRMREKQIPVDVVECKEAISAFGWDPVGSKFCFIHGESSRISASFYVIKPGKVELLRTLERRVANSIFWSPNGQFVVLAGLRSMNGILEFIDTTDMTVMSTGEHYMASDIEWDPTGRYVISAVSWWAHKVDNAYWVWSFQGRLMYKKPMERFCQILWRPRPPTLLLPEQIKEIKKNMKKYTAQFELKDRMTQSKASKELVEKRQKMMDDYRKYRNTVEEFFSAQKSQRLELREGIDTDELESHVENFEEETIEFLVKVEETVIEE